jgi:nickel-dependent lactate racemase
VPGDRVAILLEAGLPRSASIVAVLASELLHAGVSAADITVLVPQGHGPTKPLLEELPEAVRSAVQVVEHDPADRDELTYLAASADARAIYVNRFAHDADFVIPVGVLRLPETLGYYGPSGAVFPAFSDEASIALFRSPAGALDNAGRKKLCARADDVAWKLGVIFTVQLVAGRGEQVLEVLAGSPTEVGRRGSDLVRRVWSGEAPARASLVVAAIEGGASQQTWENVARALAAALAVVDDDGAIALCTDLAQRPGPALRRVAKASSLHGARQRVATSPAVDALPATELVAALEHARVYLLSKLDEDAVEQLGMVQVAEPAELERLVRRSKSCIVLANAQSARIELESAL